MPCNYQFTNASPILTWEPRPWTHTWAGRGGEEIKYSAKVRASQRHWTLDSSGLGTASSSASTHIGRTSVSFLLPGAILVSLSPVSRRQNIDSEQLCLTILMEISYALVSIARSGRGESVELQRSEEQKLIQDTTYWEILR